ncbi:hypothetical protein SDC9_121843 [bioreactor metagenome]|uniref:Uncharacterized protein n=1 Tax=bioreactor metagenome TaxID=1076179 RepID=A0A645CD49_9ZZZZ
MFEFQGGLVLVEVPGQHQRHGDLRDFRGLDACEADGQPAPGAVDLDAEEEDGNQQDNANDVERNRETHQFLWRNTGDDPHDDEGDAHVGGLRHHAVRAVVGG